MTLAGLRPRRLRGAAPPLFVQLFALIVLSLAAAQAINLAIIFYLPPPPPDIYRVSEVARAFRAGPGDFPARNGRVLRVELKDQLTPIRKERPNYFVPLMRDELGELVGAPPSRVRLALLEAVRPPARRSVRSYQSQLGPERARKGADPFLVAPFEADVQRPDGRWLTLRQLDNGILSSWQQQILLWFGSSAFVLAPVAYLFSRRLAAPITAFAAAAERLGRHPEAEPLALSGSREVETAVAAFNEMQERLRRYVHDRTGMVGAIAHDLRTPLTRLRFRLEAVPGPVQAKMAADIEQMDQMIAATMAFVRDATRPAERKPLELVSLVEAVADEMAETGLAVSAEAGPRVVVDGDPIALRRMVTNLLDNAVKFGACARARVYAEAGAAIVEVDDDGPGVPESQQEQVFEPFHRGEPSRSRQTGGAGLGLAVVRSVARAHGGDAVIENRSEGGLRARARLPLSATAA